MMLLKRLMTTVLLMFALLLPTMAQQKADTTYTFRFVPQKDMFYVPWSGNNIELARLLKCIESNRTDILDSRLPLLVDGYCNSLGSETENLATAKIRSNRVKSELITRAGIKEENFITRNHATEGDFVTVRLTVPVREAIVSDAEAEARRRLRPNVWQPRSVPNKNGLPKNSVKRKKPNQIPLPTCRRKPKNQLIIISLYVPTCCVGQP